MVRTSSSSSLVEASDPSNDSFIKLTTDEIDRCKELYYGCDGLSKENLLLILYRLGIEQPPENEIASLYPHGGSKFLDIRTFLDFLARIKNRHSIEQQNSADMDLLDAFVAMGGSRDQGGTVNTGKLRDIVRSFELTIDLERLVTELDSDESGLLDFHEFSVLLREGALLQNNRNSHNLEEDAIPNRLRGVGTEIIDQRLPQFQPSVEARHRGERLTARAPTSRASGVFIEPSRSDCMMTSVSALTSRRNMLHQVAITGAGHVEFENSYTGRNSPRMTPTLQQSNHARGTSSQYFPLPLEAVPNRTSMRLSRPAFDELDGSVHQPIPLATGGLTHRSTISANPRKISSSPSPHLALLPPRSPAIVLQEARQQFRNQKHKFPGDTTRALLGPSQLARRPMRRQLGKKCTSTSTTVILPPLDYGTFALQYIVDQRPHTSPACIGFNESEFVGKTNSSSAKFGSALSSSTKK